MVNKTFNDLILLSSDLNLDRVLERARVRRAERQAVALIATYRAMVGLLRHSFHEQSNAPKIMSTTKHQGMLKTGH